MRGKFVLAKHGQIYEPARLSSTTLTTDINIRTLQGDCITWGIGTLPTWLCVKGWFHREWAQMMHFTNCGWFISVSFYWFMWTTFWHGSCYCHWSACLCFWVVRNVLHSPCSQTGVPVLPTGISDVGDTHTHTHTHTKNNNKMRFPKYRHRLCGKQFKTQPNIAELCTSSQAHKDSD